MLIEQYFSLMPSDRLVKATDKCCLKTYLYKKKLVHFPSSIVLIYNSLLVFKRFLPC